MGKERAAQKERWWKIMEALKYKIKISVLWIIFAVSVSGAMICLYMEPGFIEKLMAGVFRCQTHSIICTSVFGEKLSEGLIVLFALWWLIPLVMSFLTHILKYSSSSYGVVSFFTLIIFDFYVYCSSPNRLVCVEVTQRGSVSYWGTRM